MSAAKNKSDEIEAIRPPEILCQIFQFAVGADGGIKALLPLTHISAQWRRAAHGDPSLWTTIHLKQTTAPLLDMALAYAGDQLFTVYVDHHDFDRLAKLWNLFDRVEELHYTHDGIDEMTPFIVSLGPAPNLKALYLQPGLATGPISTITKLPDIFSGCFPLLRSITFSNTIGWPLGLFNHLVSFECGSDEHRPISAYHALDVLRESPRLEFLRLVGCCRLPRGYDPLSIALPLLAKCTLVGGGTASLIQFIIAPATALVFLSQSDIYDPVGVFPEFNEYSVAPALQTLGEVSAVSLSVSDHAVGIQTRNDHGGVLDAKVDGLYDRSGDPPNFVSFVRDTFESWNAYTGFDATKEFTFCVDRGGTWEPMIATAFAIYTIAFFLHLPVEEINLLGVPPRELSVILDFLCSLPPVQDRCPNLKRLHIESIPLRSPRSLLAEFSGRFADRKEAGVPFESVTVKVKCETLIPAADHCAFLAAWEGSVGEGVRLEYERTEVERLPGCRRRDCGCGDEDGQDEGAAVADPGDSCVGWDGWPENWPKTLGEMRERQVEAT